MPTRTPARPAAAGPADDAPAAALLTAREAADTLGVSVRLLRDLTRPHGDLPVIRLGRLVRYRPEALRGWAAAREMTSAKAPR